MQEMQMPNDCAIGRAREYARPALSIGPCQFNLHVSLHKTIQCARKVFRVYFIGIQCRVYETFLNQVLEETKQ